MSAVPPTEPAPPPDRVERGPAGTRFSEVRRFRSIDSTNRYLLEVARLGPAEGVVAVADHQSAGRGRLGRRWEAPEGAGLLVSVLLVPRPHLVPTYLHLCNVAVALALADACRQASGLEPMLKWPNDLIVGGRKLAGVLAESVPLAPAQGPAPDPSTAARAPTPGAAVPAPDPATAGPAPAPDPAAAGPAPASPAGERRAVVVGAGLNVRWPPPEGQWSGCSLQGGPADEVLRSATSIQRETGREPERDVLLELFLVALEQRLRQLEEPAGPALLASEYRRRCVTVGQQVQVSTGHDEIRGEAVDITAEGHLVVDVGACFVTISAGDVVHLRPGA